MFSHWYDDDGGVLSNCMFVIMVCYGMSLVIYWSYYQFHRSDFHRFDWSPRQFTSVINCILGLLALLSKLAIVLTDPTFINLINTWNNLFYSKIARLILPFTCIPMQLWLLNYLAISLNSSTISGLLHYQEELFSNKRSIEKFWYWHSKSRPNCI